MLAEVNWGEFGLAGAVIGALFTLLALVLKYAADRVEKISDTHANVVREVHTAHREERSEWKTECSHQSAETRKVIQELTNVIRDSRREA